MGVIRLVNQLKAVDFQYVNVEAISQKQYDIHLELYKGYIKKINEIWDKLEDNSIEKDSNATYSLYRGLKKGETYALDGVILHELYFANLGGKINVPSGPIINEMDNFFGSYEKWKDDFIACGMSARGWTVLAYDQRSKSFHNFLCDEHDQGAIWNAFPLIVMDVYEHAYYIDYPNKKAEYIKRFLNDINWDVINKRLKTIK